MTVALVTCRGCGEDFGADDGACPACGERRREQMGFPVGDLCARCGVQRLALNGTPLELGAPCEVCGALSVRVPRKPGQLVGEVLNEAGATVVGSLPASLSNPTTEGRAA